MCADLYSHASAEQESRSINRSVGLAFALYPVGPSGVSPRKNDRILLVVAIDESRINPRHGFGASLDAITILNSRLNRVLSSAFNATTIVVV